MKFESIQLCDSVNSWEDAVRQSSMPLLEKGIILQSYQDAMIENINKLGSYMIIIPGVAMPHSRPEDGANQTAVSLLVLKEEVVFPENNKVWLILCLAANTSDAHIDAIESIADLLGDEEKLEHLQKATTIEQITSII